MTRGLPDLNRIKRILIIRLSSIGDVVHALPVSAALKTAYPHLEISWAVEDMSAPIVHANPDLHEVIVMPRRRWKRSRFVSPRVWQEYAQFLWSIRRKKFEVTLDLQGYTKSGMIALFSGARYRIGWRRVKDVASFASTPIRARSASVHRVDWYLDVLRELGIQPGLAEFRIQIPATAHSEADQLLEACGFASDRPFAIVSPSVGDNIRRWGSDRYGALVSCMSERFGMPIILAGSSSDDSLCEEILANAGSRNRVTAGEPADSPLILNLAGRTNLSQLMALIERCAVHVSGDTGSAHIAAALNRPTVTLYGPTDPDHAGTWGQEENMISRREVCGPNCSLGGCTFTNGQYSSRVSGTKCLATIEPMDVIKKIAEAMSRGD